MYRWATVIFMAAFCSLMSAVSVPALDFGSVRAGGSRDLTTTIPVLAPNGALISSIVLDGGLWFSAGFRRMAGTQPGQFLQYQIFQDDGVTPWNANENKSGWVMIRSNGDPFNMRIKARVTTAPTTAPGTYSDIITVTVNY